MSDASAPDETGGNIRSRLTMAAREYWGDEWFIRCHIDSDGDEQWHAAHTQSVPVEGVAVREEMTIYDGDIDVNRWVIDTKEYVSRASEGMDSAEIRRLLLHRTGREA